MDDDDPHKAGKSVAQSALRSRANQIGAAHARLFLPVDAATEQKPPMLLECAEALFERMEQWLRHLWVLARVKRVLDDYTLANDLDFQFGDLPVGLGKMLLSATHGFAGSPPG
jgi:hypothetical protein